MDLVKSAFPVALGRVTRVNLERDATLSASDPSLNVGNDRARLADDHSVFVEIVRCEWVLCFRLASST